MTDNVRKVFDLLGVEPNERFKLKGNDNDLYCLTENLMGYLFDEKGNEYGFMDNWLLKDTLINPERIIKLPKEPKKKKLRDWTPEDFDKWKKKICNKCDKCIFKYVDCVTKNSWVNHKDLYSDKFLNQEIEVEE